MAWSAKLRLRLAASLLQGETGPTSICHSMPSVWPPVIAPSNSYDDTRAGPLGSAIPTKTAPNMRSGSRDARSIRAKLSLIPEYGLDGAGY